MRRTLDILRSWKDSHLTTSGYTEQVNYPGNYVEWIYCAGQIYREQKSNYIECAVRHLNQEHYPLNLCQAPTLAFLLCCTFLLLLPQLLVPAPAPGHCEDDDVPESEKSDKDGGAGNGVPEEEEAEGCWQHPRLEEPDSQGVGQEAGQGPGGRGPAQDGPGGGFVRTCRDRYKAATRSKEGSQICTKQETVRTRAGRLRGEVSTLEDSRLLTNFLCLPEQDWSGREVCLISGIA